MAAMMIVGMLPTPFVHRAVLTPDRFDLRIGTWYSPREYSIRFDDVAYADIEDDVDNKSARTRQYVLECYLKRPDARRPVLLPICDLVKPALRQIVNALEKRAGRSSVTRIMVCGSRRSLPGHCGNPQELHLAWQGTDDHITSCLPFQ